MLIQVSKNVSPTKLLVSFSGLLQEDQAMGVEQEKTVIYDHRLSTVVPATVTGNAVLHELTTMDLIMKLHYQRAVYYFNQTEIIDGITIADLKNPMFLWLNIYYPMAGRIRRAESGRPLIKCNDCGLRIIEAKCTRTLGEWLDVESSSRWRLLVPDKVLGPDLQFSPMAYMQEADEWQSVEELVDIENGKPDFVLYGANLTFVDMEGINLYGLELKGQKPIQVDYSIDGVGDEGAVLVLQGPQRANATSSNQERIVMVILPEDEIPQLCELLSGEFGITQDLKINRKLSL
ncbi:hypothetical protein BHM03_00001994 [Ensete ventricosum]|uniref:Uncharacterized protein n=1 Tax=Ensete ventricosum TaxID=4639 RepID=A0A445M9F7_ENSVE|nr:hypothetical protein BHM03_00001994 [Ensete ventricosum]